MNYKGFVFFDLDGTLLNENSELTKENCAAIMQLKENGYLPIIASGRAPFEIEALTHEAAIDSYVSLNGHMIVHHKETIYADSFDIQSIENILAFAQKHQHALAYYSKDTYKINTITESAKLLYAYDHAPLPAVDTEYYKEEPIYFLYLFTQDTDLDAAYQKAFGDMFTFYRDSPYSMAVVKKGNSKQHGIQLLLEKLQGEQLPTFAFGDGMNDLPMLACVDTAIVMENANDTVKEAADYITGTNTERGIIDALEHFKLI